MTRAWLQIDQHSLGATEHERVFASAGLLHQGRHHVSRPGAQPEAQPQDTHPGGLEDSGLPGQLPGKHTHCTPFACACKHHSCSQPGGFWLVVLSHFIYTYALGLLQVALDCCQQCQKHMLAAHRLSCSCRARVCLVNVELIAQDLINNLAQCRCQHHGFQNKIVKCIGSLLHGCRFPVQAHLCSHCVLTWCSLHQSASTLRRACENACLGCA